MEQEWFVPLSNNTFTHICVCSSELTGCNISFFKDVRSKDIDVGGGNES